MRGRLNRAQLTMAERVIIFGKRFAALRRDRFLTQEEFAQRLEMSPANVRRLEQSEAGGMQVKNFRRLAALVNVSPADLRQQIGPAAGMTPAPALLRRRTSRVTAWKFHRASMQRPGEISLTCLTSTAYPPHGPKSAPMLIAAARVPAGSSRRFAVTVDGDCMEPKYHHGETVVFSVMIFSCRAVAIDGDQPPRRPAGTGARPR